MIYKISAVIPVGQYANLQPSIEVEADSFEEAEAKVLPYIETLWQKYGEKPLVSRSDGFVKKSGLGGEFLYNEAEHKYKTLDGKDMLSGSAFAKRYSRPFDMSGVSAKFAEKHGLEASEIVEMWDCKREVSTTFGIAVHKALEYYGKHAKTIKKTGGEFDIHPLIKQLVLDFYENRSANAMYEVFVTDGERVGQIDRLVITGDKKCIVEDWKTNGSMSKGSGKMLAPYDDLKDTSLNHYRLQLSFYADILTKIGWTVEGLRLHHLTDKWETINIEGVTI